MTTTPRPRRRSRATRCSTRCSGASSSSAGRSSPPVRHGIDRGPEHRGDHRAETAAGPATTEAPAARWRPPRRRRRPRLRRLPRRRPPPAPRPPAPRRRPPPRRPPAALPRTRAEAAVTTEAPGPRRPRCRQRSRTACRRWPRSSPPGTTPRPARGVRRSARGGHRAARRVRRVPPRHAVVAGRARRHVDGARIRSARPRALVWIPGDDDDEASGLFWQSFGVLVRSSTRAPSERHRVAATGPRPGARPTAFTTSSDASSDGFMDRSSSQQYAGGDQPIDVSVIAVE